MNPELFVEMRKVVIISRNKLILTLLISWCFAPEKQLSNKSAAHLTLWSGITVWLLLFSPGLHHFNKYVNLMKKLCYRWVFLLHHRKKDAVTEASLAINGHAFTDNTLQSACCKNDCHIILFITKYLKNNLFQSTSVIKTQRRWHLQTIKLSNKLTETCLI